MLEPCEFEVVLQIDDDFWLSGPLDLDRHVETLLNETGAGWIRLMDIVGHNYSARLIGAYWWVDWASPGLYIPSNRAHLKHRRFHDAFGFYPEDKKLADTENEFCQRCKDRAGHSLGWPQVLVPLDVATESLWQHIGPSWQKEGY